MKELPHDKWIKEQKLLYSPHFKTYYENPGFKTHFEWYEHELYKIKGATNNNENTDGPNVRHTKHQGGTSDMNNDKKYDKISKDYIKYVPPRFDMENLFSFSYEDMFNETPNIKFNKLLNLVFNHKFDDIYKNIEQDKWIEIYNEMKNNGKINIVNSFYQRLSNYIKKNKLSKEWVDGSIICNIAIIISEYLKTNELKFDYDFINNIEKYNNDDDYRYHLWLILQCFTSKNIYHKKYISNKYIQNWWSICHLRHRISDKDMKTKGQCCGFKDNNGKYIYKSYG